MLKSKRSKLKRISTKQPLIQKEVDFVDYEKIVVDIIIQQWRLLQLFIKATSKLENVDQNRYVNQIRYIQKSVDDSLKKIGLTLVNLENQPYDIGMAATVLNMDDFEIDDKLMVKQMLEPLIMKNGIIKREAVINLAKVGQ